MSVFNLWILLTLLVPFSSSLMRLCITNSKSYYQKLFNVDNNVDSFESFPKNSKNLEYLNVLNDIRFISFLSFLIPFKANAAKGAFEMDMEFYVKNALFGNNEVSNKLKQSVRRPIYKSPRNISYDLANLILDISINEITKLTKYNSTTLINLVNNKISNNLTYYKSFLPIQSYDLNDQYYYDIYLLNLFLLTSKLIPDSKTRVLLKQNIGNQIYNYFMKNKLIDISNEILSGQPKDIPLLCINIKKILDYYKLNGFISDYIFDIDDASDIEFAKQSFQQGLPITYQITLKDPIPIVSFIEMTLADTLFHPEIIASTITSYIKNNNFNCRFDDYLMDNFYREENFNVQAQDIIIEILINQIKTV